jgi:hypothetical protein
MATLIVNTGRAVTTALLAGGVTYPKFVGWGTGAGTAGATDTDLFTPATEARVTGAQSQITTTTTNDTYQVVATLTANAGKTITNVMIFDSAGSGSPPSGGNGYFKGDHAGQALNNGDQIQYTLQTKYT